MYGSGGIGTYVVILSRVVVNCGLIKYIPGKSAFRANRHSKGSSNELPKKSHREIQKNEGKDGRGIFFVEKQ